MITHLIPVRVLSAEYISSEKEPTLPPEDVHILLPPTIETLRAVSERYKSLNDKLYVMANMAGELKLRVEAEEVKVETRWTGLVNPPLGFLVKGLVDDRS
jgi:Hus1-like protein